MAFPIILVNSATGSDTLASGAGMATAINGSNASFSGDTVTVDGSPDLTNVPTDGSGVLRLVTTTGAQFFKILARNVGAFTFQVTPNPAGTTTGRTWAHGGKRASLTSASSLFLTDNAGAAGDAKGGWILQMESGHVETKTTTSWNIWSLGNVTDGPLIIRGAPGAAVKPIITFSGAGIGCLPRGNYMGLQDFNLAGTGGATTCIIQAGSPVGLLRLERLKISGFSGILIDGTGAVGLMNSHVLGCDLGGGSTGIVGKQNLKVIGNYLHDQTGVAINCVSADQTGLAIISNVIADAGGDGIAVIQTRTDGYAGCLIAGNTIDGCTGDGIQYTGDNNGLAGLSIYNNIIANNGAYGINFASLTAEKVKARGPLISHNNTFNNTSGVSNLSGVLENNTEFDPEYADASGGDFTPLNDDLLNAAFGGGMPGAVQPVHPTIAEITAAAWAYGNRTLT